jgi:hypothetical protein
MRIEQWTVCLASLCLVVTATGCATDFPTSPTSAITDSGAAAPVSARLGSPAGTPPSVVNAVDGPRPRPQSWADGELFGGVVTPATFNPANGNFDELYAIPGGAFKDGVPLISESKPGDQDYNGGRWHMNVLKAGVDPAKYANADRDGHLDMNDFMSTDQYFECPLLPRRGNN